jgi:hypothetical protein
MPANIVRNNNNGVCGATVSWIAPTSTDNCTGQILLQTEGVSNGGVFPIGETVVTYTVTDASGNITTASFTVTVNDVQHPVINNLPSNIIQSSTENVCGALVNWTVPTTSDNCFSVILQTAGLENGSEFPVGVSVITYTAVDGAGNEATGSFTITILDNQNPVISEMPFDFNIVNDLGSCGAILSWEAPRVEDNCAVTLVQTSGVSNGGLFPIGTTVVTYTATDASGNDVSASFNVTVKDTENPTILGLPENITDETNIGVCGATVTWTEPTSADNCTGHSIAQTGGTLNGQVFPVGTTTVTYTATDASGNSFASTFTVTVIDNEKPTIVGLPSNITVNNNTGVCGATVSWTVPTSADNCSGHSIAQTAGTTNGGVFSVGTTTVTYTATDASGNTFSSSFTVTVNDTENPTINNLPSNIVVTNNTGVCGATVIWTAPSSADNCTGHSIAQTAGTLNGGVFAIGTTTVTYTATDASGNQYSASFTVTVNDTELPVIIDLPSNTTVSNNTNVCGAIVTWIEPRTSDNCSSTIAQTAGLSNGSLFPIGVSTITYTATDASGNPYSASFTVTVNDNQLPTINGTPANILVNNNTGVCGATVSWVAPTSSDNCPGHSVAQTAGVSNGGVFPIGTTTVTYTATDASGNINTSSFTVTVTDNEKPTINGLPSNITVSNNTGVCGAVVTWTVPTSADNCTGHSIAQTAGVTNGGLFSVGTTYVTYTATDASGNQYSSSFSVTVNDTENPTIVNLPSNITVNNNTGVCGALVTWTAPTSADNCTGHSIAQTAGFTSGSVFPVGITTVTYTSTDAYGNQHSLSFTVTVIDNENPTINGMPSNITVNNNTGVCGATVAWTSPTSADNCSGHSIAQTAGTPNGGVFSVGTTTVNYTATDAAGNQISASFTVTVIDNENPVINGLPSNITITNNTGVCGATVSWNAPTTADNCFATIAQTGGVSNGGVFPIGTTTVTYTATDLAGNNISASFTVTVNDTENPTIVNLPSNINVSNDINVCGAIATWTAPTSADNCSGHSIAQTAGLASGSVFPIGTTVITYTATDASGNQSSSSFNVTVSDTQNPTIACVNNQTRNTNTGVCTYTTEGNEFNPSAFADNCSATILNNLTNTNTLAGYVFPRGTTTVTWTVTDASNNSINCSFTVTVADNQQPTFTTCPGNKSVFTVTNACTYTKSGTDWNATASDFCGVTSLTYSLSGASTGTGTSLNNQVFGLGTTLVTWSAADGSTTPVTCSYTVTVIDNVFPVIACPADTTITKDENCESVIPDFTGSIIATDNCGIASVTQFPPDGSTISGSVFSYPITITVTDNSGNVSTCTFEAIFRDLTPPLFSNTPANIVTYNTAGSCTKVVTWTPPTVYENCSGIAPAVVTSNYVPGNVFPLGVTTVTYTAHDTLQNFSYYSFTITVVDTVKPLLTISPNISLNSDYDGTGNCSAVVAIPNSITSDNCSVASCSWAMTGVTTGASTSAGVQQVGSQTFNVGVTTITYTLTDGSGNVTIKSLNVTITDNELPSITCAAPVSVFNTPGLCTAPITLIQPVTDDNCGVSTVTNDHPSTIYPVGTTTVTWTVTDIHGNSNTCTQTVTVTDNEKPTITCEAPVSVFNDLGLCSAVVTLIVPTTNDNCAVSTVVNDHPSTTFIVGTTTVTWTVTDIHGNINTCTQTVTVTDDESPVIENCPSNITVYTENGSLGCNQIASWPAPVPTDNCAVSTFSANHYPGETYPVGTTPVTYTVVDIHGNFTTWNFNVIVIDNTAPSITCPADITHTADAGLCGYTTNIGLPTTSDYCGVSTTVGVRSDALALGAQYPVGITTITWTVTDIHNNTNSCVQTVTVTDNEAPSITCPAPVSVFNTTGECSTTITLLSPVTADNCGVSTVTNDHPSTTYPVGTTTVTWTVTDIHGNSNTCTQLVTVNDNEKPTIVNCPSNVTVYTGAGRPGCNQTASWIAPTANDNCNVSSLVSDHQIGDTFPVGTTTVTYTATDIHGNSSNCYLTVTVIDNTNPVITQTPDDITVYSNSLNPQTCTQLVSWTAPIANDNCGVSSLTADHNIGDAFPVGTTLVTYTAVDIHGNNITSSFNVTVVDNTKPDFTFCTSPVINATVNAASCQASIPTVNPTVTDACGVVKLTWTMTGATIDASVTTGINYVSNPYIYNVGSTTVTYTATDAAGNVNTCTYTVSVVNTLESNILGTTIVLQNAASPFITLAGNGGTLPYTFTYNVNGGTNQTITTTGNNTSVTIPQSTFSVGEFVYTLVSVTDFYGCTGALPVDTKDTISVLGSLPRPDLYSSVDEPVNSTFSTSDNQEGYITIANASANPTTGVVKFRVLKPVNFTLQMLESTTTSAGVAVNNSDWTITSSGFAYEFQSKSGVVISANGSNKIGFKLTALGSSNSNYIMTISINNGTGGSSNTTGDTNNNNNQSVNLFIIN